tara:strand:- start:352 stop:528 length:177 start_codon:yes stop_codon:yes gene_type:complete
MTIETTKKEMDKAMDIAIDLSQSFYWNVYNKNRTKENLYKYHELCKVWERISNELYKK